MSDYSKKYASIKHNKEFQFLFKKGSSIVTSAFVCYYRESRRRVNRCGIMTGKKIGGAVIRNRARRVIREAFRQSEPWLREKTGKRYDFIFVARAHTPEMKSGRIAALIMNKVMKPLTGDAV